MGDKPRVMVVGPFPPMTGGVTTFMLNLINSTQRDDWEFVCYSLTRPLRTKPYRGMVLYAGFLQGGLVRALKSAAVTVRNAVVYPSALVRCGARVAQIQSSSYFAFWEAMLYVIMTRALGRRAVVRFGGSFDHFYEGSNRLARMLIRRAVGAADAIVVQSPYWRDYFSEVTDPSKLHVIPNVIQKPSAAPERDRHELPVTAVFVCGPQPVVKGFSELLEAVPRLRGKVHVRCVAALEDTRKLIEDAGASDVIEPLGVLNREDLDAEYRQADMLVIPSHGEGFPNTLLEAMAAALPVVATPVGAIRDVVEEGVNGYLVPVGDPNALAEAMLSLAGDPDKRRRMGTANWRKVVDVYERDRAFGRFGDIWRSAIAR